MADTERPVQKINRKALTYSNIKWWSLALIAIAIKILSLDRNLVEHWYSGQVYPKIAIFTRFLFGWLPFSFGDIIYLSVGLWIVWNVSKIIRRLIKRSISKEVLKRGASKALFSVLVIYVAFNLLWGLNYNRKGIASQLDLPVAKYDSAELRNIVYLLRDKVNVSKTAWLASGQAYPSNKRMFDRAAEIYKNATPTFPYLNVAPASLKSSIFSTIGNYLGITGYYNPFTGEAQVNTSAPKFLQPFTTAHEIAHQAGYAKENEASFVAYLAIATSGDPLFLYSTYLDMFIFANRAFFVFNAKEALAMSKSLLPEVKKDIEEWRRFSAKHTNPVEPFFRWMYGKFLKINDQPKGMFTYNEVVGNLIAYYKKYGKI